MASGTDPARPGGLLSHRGAALCEERLHYVRELAPSSHLRGASVAQLNEYSIEIKALGSMAYTCMRYSCPH